MTFGHFAGTLLSGIPSRKVIDERNDLHSDWFHSPEALIGIDTLTRVNVFALVFEFENSPKQVVDNNHDSTLL